jgi:hypothetical protein
MTLPYLLTSIYLLTGTYSYYPVEDVGIVGKIITLRSYEKGCLKLREITFSYYNLHIIICYVHLFTFLAQFITYFVDYPNDVFLMYICGLWLWL